MKALLQLFARRQPRKSQSTFFIWVITTLLLTGQFATLSPAGQVYAAGSGNDGSYELHGAISVLPSAANFVGDWTVAGKTIHVTATTRLEQENSTFAVGAYVEVKGVLQSDGSVNATKIELQIASAGGSFSEFTGAIEELPSTPDRTGDWQVAGTVVHVAATTRVRQEHARIAVGVQVEVKGTRQSDGSVNAIEIETKSGAGSGETKFTGTIEELPDTPDRTGDWKISGRTVHVSATTVIRQENLPPGIGVTVKVEGIPQPDGSLTATEIETKDSESDDTHVEFRGTVESLPGTTGQIGDWQISGRTVHVTSSTRIKQEYGPVAIGSIVEVEGARQADGSVNAAKIEIEDRVSAPIRNTPGYCRFYGVVRSLPTTQDLVGEWNVGGHKLNVTTETKINQEKGPVAVGVLVEVLAVLKAGVLEAVSIEVKQPAGSSAGYVKFFGTIGALPAAQDFVGDWTVGGRTVHVTSSTRLEQEKGKIVVGAFVEIVGNQRADGSVDATEIEVKSDNSAIGGSTGFISFYGTIGSLPSGQNLIGDWTVSGKTVHVSATTKIEQERGTVAPGALVEVKGNRLDDGSIDATKIEVKATSIGGGADVTFIEIVGNIDSLPDTTNLVGDWKVDGRTVRVSAATFIKREHGTVAVGVLVEVKGALQADGSIDAAVIEVKRSSNFNSFAPLASVSAGSYQPDNSADSIIASFGVNLAQTTQTATKLPLPTVLGGVSVLVDDKPAGLFFVSPGQINYLVPAGIPAGSARVAIIRNNAVVTQGTLQLPGVAPAVFTADASGQGLPAALLLRVRANQQQSYEPVARYDASLRKFIAVPVKRETGDKLYLILFGTGFRTAPDTDGNNSNGIAENIQATIGNVTAPVLYAGEAPGFAGLDQINLELPVGAAGSNSSILLKVADGQGSLLRSNTVTITIQ